MSLVEKKTGSVFGSTMVAALILLFAVVAISCESPAGPDGGSSPSASPTPSTSPSPGPDNGVNAPGWVEAHYIGTQSGNETIRVTWESKADSYEVYRKVGQADWSMLASLDGATTFNDNTFYDGLTDPNNPLPVRYAVKSKKGTVVSSLSAPSNGTSPVVLDTEASILSLLGRVRVQWASHPEAESYNIYRFPNGAEANPTPVHVITGLPASQGTLFWEDIPSTVNDDPKPNQPYFYLVTWVKAGQEYGFGETGSFFSLGSYSTQIDKYEPNDDWTELPNQSTPFSDAEPPMAYSFITENGTVADADWYQYIAQPNEGFFVTVTIPADSLFDSNELQITFFYNDQTFGSQKIAKPGPQVFPSPPFAADATGDQRFYFKIEPSLLQDRNVTGSYKVSVSDSL